MASQIQLRRDTAANWQSVNPTLAQGEIGVETDTGKIKLGTGLAAWNSLSYFVGNIAGTTLDSIGDVTITSVQNGDFLRYNGSASVWINDPVNLATDTIGDYVQSLVAGTGVTLSNNSGEGATPTVAIGQDVATSASPTFAGITINGPAIVFEGATANDYETTLQVTDPTADRTLTLPNATDTLVGKATTDTFTNKTFDTAGAGNSFSINGNQISSYVGTGPNVVLSSLPTISNLYTAGVTVDGSGVKFEGTTVNQYSTSLVAVDPTANNTVTIPNASGTVALSGSIALGADTTGSYVQSLVQGTGVTITNNSGEGATPTIAIGQAVGTSSSVQFAKVETTGDVVVGGNLTVNGTTTTLNTETLAIEDNIVVLNSGATGTPTLNAGIEVERGDSPNVVLRWNENTEKWQTTENGTDYYDIIDSYSIETRLNEYSFSQTVRLATYAVLPNSPTYTPGTLDADGGYGIGATLESSSNARLVVDGIQANNTNLILVKNQTDATQNGIYEVTAQGSASEHWVLTRADNNNGTHPNEVHNGEFIDSQEGDKNSKQRFAVVSYGTGANGAHVIGTDDIDILQISGVYSFTAGDGLVVTDNTLNVATANSGRIVVAANSIDLAEIVQDDVSSSPSLAFVSSIERDAYGRVLGVTTGDAQVTLGQNTTGNYVASLVAGTGINLANNSGETATPTVSIGQDVATSASVTFVHVSADVTGDLTGNVTGDVTGNADTATTLETARTISLTGDVSGSVSFDGSADATITATIQPNSVALGTDTSGAYVGSLVQGTGVTITNNSGEGSTPGIAIGQDVATSASVQFAAVTAPLVGNASTASALQTSRTIALSGDVSGSVSFDGSASAEIVATIQPNSVALGTDTTGNYVSDVTAGTGISITHTPGEGSSATVAIDATLDNLSNVTVPSPSSGDFLKWNGSAWVNDPINLGTDTTGNYMSDLTQGTGVTITHTPGEGSNATIAIGQAVGTSASVTFAHVSADVTGNVTGNVTGSSGSTTGNAATATTLETARTISLTGDVSGSVSFNGSQDVSISATVQPNSVALGTDTTGNYVNDVVAGTGITVTHTPGEGSSASVALNASIDDLSDVNINTFAFNSGDILEWNGTNWVNTNKLATFGFAQLADYNNPVFGPPANGTVLTRNSSTGKWEPTQPNYALGTQTTGDYVQSLVAGTGLTITNNSGEGATPTIAIGQNVSTSSSVVFAQIETTGTLIVGGNLQVSGSVQTVNQTSLELDDPFIYLNTTASVSGIDTGVVASYYDGSHKHSGYFRDATDGKFKFFDSYTSEPANPINTADPSYSAAPVVAEYFESTVSTGTAPLSVSSSTVVTNLNADKLDGNDASYFLNTSSVLDDISNVSASAPADGNFLKYVSASSAWVPASIPTINALDDIGDVDAASPSSGEYLKWNGTKWVAATPNLDDLKDVDAPSPSTGDVLKWNGTKWVPGVGAAAPTSTTITSTSPETISSFDATAYRTVEYIIQVSQGSAYTSLKALLVHDGTDAYLSQYAIINIGSISLTLTTLISSGTMYLKATIPDADSTTAYVKVLQTTIAV